MKNVITLLFFFVLGVQNTIAQSVPLGMKYQAVARDPKGQVLANKDLQLKISLYANLAKPEKPYVEIHKIVTNELGLFSLSIGEGIAMQGKFEAVPWSSEEIWLEVGIQLDDETDFVTISNSKMLSVPYAFHAATASELTGDPGRGGELDPHLRQWNLQSNYNTTPGRDVLGTGDMKDLVIVTNGTERIRISSAGDVRMEKNVSIGGDMEVERNVYLNTDINQLPSSAGYVPGETINFGDFTVESESETHLTGTLTTDQHTELNSTLNVDGLTTISNSTQSNSPSFGALVVDGGVGIEKNLNVGGATTLEGSLDVLGLTTIENTTQSTTINNGALVVEGGVGIEKNLNVGGDVNFGGEASFSGQLYIMDGTQSNNTTTGALVVEGGVGIGKNLNVGGTMTVKGTNPSFMATIENADGDSGDGLKIKLGKTHPRWVDNPIPPFSNEISAQLPGFTLYSSVVSNVKDLFKGLMISPEETFSVSNFTSIGLDLQAAVETELGASLETYASAACNLTKDIITEINDELGLAWNFPTLNTPALHISDAVTIFGGIDALDIPPLVVPAIDIPSATIINSFQVFPEIPVPTCPPAPSISDWTLPNFSITDVPNSLGHANQFIQFVDKDNRQVGTIRAESIEEWCDRKLTLPYFLDVFNTFAGNFAVGIDPTQIVETVVKFGISGLNEVVKITEEYNTIGVEYSSGFGDYAEWLERTDLNEPITPGDIVAVKGGKITRDLTGAEQIMAVSSNPIMLGNTPPVGNEYKGNKVAFMGQIPVKVMGPVHTGDFIVGTSDIPGYGIAIHPSDMTASDIEKAVGRSWETMDGTGPKLVNTVVGVHNGSFIHVMKKYETRLDDNDKRLSSIEKQLSSLLPVANNN